MIEKEIHRNNHSKCMKIVFGIHATTARAFHRMKCTKRVTDAIYIHTRCGNCENEIVCQWLYGKISMAIEDVEVNSRNKCVSQEVHWKIERPEAQLRTRLHRSHNVLSKLTHGGRRHFLFLSTKTTKFHLELVKISSRLGIKAKCFIF